MIELTQSTVDLIRQKLLSRKFWVWVFSICTALAGYFSGTVSADVTIAALIAAGAAYQVSEGVADAGRRN